MEKVKIISVIDKGLKTRDGNPMITVELEDGRKCTAYTADAMQWTGEMELEIKEGAKIGDVQYYNAFEAKPKQKGSFTSQRDYTWEKRNASLQRSIETFGLSGMSSVDITSDNIVELAEIYFDYLNTK